MPEAKDGCVSPAKGPIGPEAPDFSEKQEQSVPEVVKMQAKVGKPAPDFGASAYVGEEGFKNIKLSDYKGKWVVVCFYPGDVTFV